MRFGKYLQYFTDLGEVPIERYAVWDWNPVKQRHEVREVSHDLETLKEKYGDLDLIKLGDCHEQA